MLKPKSPSSHFLKLRWGLACQLEMMMLLQQCWKVDKMTFSLQFAAMHQTFHKLTKNLEWKFKTFLRKNQLCKLQKFCKNVPLTEHLLSQKFVFRYKLKRVSLGSSWVNFLVTCCPSRWSNFERRWRISLTLLCSLLFRSWISREGFLCYTKKSQMSRGKNIYQATPFGSCLLWGWVDYNSNLFCVVVLCAERRRQIESPSPSKRILQSIVFALEFARGFMHFCLAFWC